MHPVVASLWSDIGELETGSPAGIANLLTLGLVAGAFLFPTIFRAAGAFIDRVIYLILALKDKDPRDYEKTPFVDEGSTILEVGAVCFVGFACVLSLSVIS